MIEICASEASVSSGPRALDEHRGCSGSVRLLDWKASQELQTLEEFSPLNINTSCINSLEQTFFSLGQQPIQLVRLQLRDWFSGLTAVGRRQALTFRSGKITGWLVRLFAAASQPAEIERPTRAAGEKIFDLDSVCKARGEEDTALKSAIEVLVGDVRIADDGAPNDTFSVSTDLVGAPEQIFSLLDKISGGKAFSSLSSFSRRLFGFAASDESNKDAVLWEVPAWVDSCVTSFSTTGAETARNDLAICVAATLERLLWLAFALGTAGISGAQPTPLRETECLLHLWRGLSQPQQQAMVDSGLKGLLAPADLARVEAGLPESSVMRTLGDTQKYSNALKAFAELVRDVGKSAADTGAQGGELGMTVPRVDPSKINGYHLEVKKKKKKRRGLADFAATMQQQLPRSGWSGSKGRSHAEACIMEDDQINTSVSTQVSAKSKCGSRKISTEDLGLTKAGHQDLDEDPETVAVKATERIMRNVLERIEDCEDLESESESFLESDREEMSRFLRPGMLDADVAREANVFRMFFAQIMKDEDDIIPKKEETKIELKEKPEFAVECQVPRSRANQSSVDGSFQVFLNDYSRATDNSVDCSGTTRNGESTLAKLDFDLNDSFDKSFESCERYLDPSLAAGLKHVSCLARLSVEMAAIVQTIDTFNSGLRPYRTRLVESINRAVKRYLSPVQVEIETYGSLANGLAVEHSDIDLRVTGTQHMEGEEIKAAMSILEKKLRTECYVKSIKAILTARVPVIKMTADLSALVPDFPDEGVEQFQKVDITMAEESTGTTTNFVCDMLHNMVHLKGVVLILKKILASNALHIPFAGGISSYSLVMMCAAFAHTYGAGHSAGEALVRTLEFYAQQFDNTVYGIYFNGFGVTYYPLRAPVGEDALVITDPLNSANNIASNVYRYGEVKKCFARVLASITNEARSLGELIVPVPPS